MAPPPAWPLASTVAPMRVMSGPVRRTLPPCPALPSAAIEPDEKIPPPACRSTLPPAAPLAEMSEAVVATNRPVALMVTEPADCAPSALRTPADRMLRAEIPMAPPVWPSAEIAPVSHVTPPVAAEIVPPSAEIEPPRWSWPMPSAGASPPRRMIPDASRVTVVAARLSGSVTTSIIVRRASRVSRWTRAPEATPLNCAASASDRATDRNPSPP